LNHIQFRRSGWFSCPAIDFDELLSATLVDEKSYLAQNFPLHLPMELLNLFDKAARGRSCWVTHHEFLVERSAVVVFQGEN